MPLLSVIVPSYNSEGTIERCIASLTTQRLSDLEIIVVDDGSTDGSFGMCCQLAASDKRIKVYAKSNGGQGIARNYGLAHARGEYVGFVDADDACSPEMYATLVGAARESCADLVIAGYRDIHSEKVVKEHPLEARLLRGSLAIQSYMADLIALPGGDKGSGCIAVWDSIFRRDLLIRNAIEFPSERNVYSEDLVFKLRVLKAAETLRLVPSCLYEYHIGNQSFSKLVDISVIKRIVSMHRMLQSEFGGLQWDLDFASRNAARSFFSLRFSMGGAPFGKGRSEFFRTLVADSKLQECLGAYRPTTPINRLIFRLLMSKRAVPLSCLFAIGNLKGLIK